jgi:hypothetical protein
VPPSAAVSVSSGLGAGQQPTFAVGATKGAIEATRAGAACEDLWKSLYFFVKFGKIKTVRLNYNHKNNQNHEDIKYYEINNENN